MAYLNNFKNDIFFSYAHVDNDGPRPGDKIIEDFYQIFRFQMNKYIGKADTVEIWFDGMLRANYQFNPVIANSLKESAIFFAFTSPGFNNSNYCNLEINTFHTEASNSTWGIAPKNKSRIFNVQLLNMHYLDWHPLLNGTGGFKLFRTLHPNGADLGITLKTTDTNYGEEMYKIIGAARELLRDLKEAEQPIPKPTLVPDKKQVFIGKVSDTLSPLKKQLIKELEAINISVLDCKSPPPYDKQKHEKKIEEQLNDVQLSIHLFDDVAGDQFDSEDPDDFDKANENTFEREQVRIAQRLKKDQLIFVAQELDFDQIENSHHGKFLTELITNKTETDQYNLIREFSIPAMIDLITRKLKPTPTIQHQGDCILLDFNEADLQSTIAHYNYLISKGKRIYMTTPGRTPFEEIKIYETALKEVTRVIIVCVSVAQDWMIERIRQVAKAIKIENSQVVRLSIYNGADNDKYDDVDITKIY